jgi:outer membrane protein assembly factor BamB
MDPALLLLVLAVSPFEDAANWPQFRGPNSSGVAAADAAPPVEFGASKRLLWKQALPAGHSSPAVWGDRIFVTAFDAAANKLELLCLARQTGAIQWRRSAAATQMETTHEVSNPATATPAVDAERVYAYFSSYGLLAFSHAGEAQWTLPLPPPRTNHGSGSSPVLAGNLLILSHDASQGGYLLAVDRRTGKEAWKQTYPAPQTRRVESYSTAVVWRDQVIVHRAGVIDGYELSSGKPRWSLAVSTSGLSTPVTSADMVYAETWNGLGEADQRGELPDFATLLKKYDKDGDGAISEAEFPEDMVSAGRPGLEQVPHSQNYVKTNFRGIDQDRDGKLQEAEWESFRKRFVSMAQEHGLLALRPDGDTARIVWRENNAIPEVPSPLLYQGRIFLVRNGGVVTCLDAATGKLIYRTRAAGAGGPYFASPVAAGGRVYLTSGEGVVTVLAAGKNQLEVLARNELGEDVFASPAIVGRTIFVRTARTLYAFGD